MDCGVDEDLRQWMLDIRRHLHRYPELSYEEHRTAAFIRQKLAERGIAGRTIGETGVVAEIGPDDSPGPLVGLRADMDALPITEYTGLPFASDVPGRMHACGHDGHVAMLLGAATLLQRAPWLPGRIRLLFQPAEERGNGALRMIESGALAGVGAIFAGHIDTHYRTGQITVDQGIICAYADPFSIKLHGRSGHAARPHEAVDVVVAGAGLVMAVQTLISREVDPNRAEVITIGSFQAGTANNVIAGEALLKGTIRSTDEATRQRTIDGLKRIVGALESMYAVRAELVFEDSLPAVINDVRATEVARAAAWETTAIDEVISQGPASLGGEDFAFYQQRVSGCLVRFGATPTDNSGPAHSDTFSFDEGCLEIGARWLAQVAWRWLLQPGPVTAKGDSGDHGH
ncbi:MAG: amidohydrolase [Desulfofustis sp.]|nr:amidohydrolase [Desulfofustis sp.]